MFSRRKQGPPAIVRPIPSHLDEQWFRDYWNTIIKEADVDPTDDGNQVELIMFTLHLLDGAAQDYMSQRQDHRAFTAYQTAMEDPANCSAQTKVAWMVGWNQQTLPLIEEKLNKFFGILVGAGRKNGYLRFFWTQCHEERRDYPNGHPVCSVCKQPADF
jgi:hypothetical protein